MTESETQDKRELILDAALEVFSEVGYERATIKAIAKRAGIKSPALLYWYFPSKADIMRAVMGRFVPLVAPTADQDFLIHLPTDQLMRMFGMGLLSGYRSNPRMAMSFRLIFSEILHDPNSNIEVLKAGPAVMLDMLAKNIEANIASGFLRPHNPKVSSRMFVGSLILYILGSSIVPSMGEDLPAADTYIEAIIAHLLDGLRVSKE